MGVLIMKFAYIPKATFHIGDVIAALGKPMRIESYSHTGKNVVACSLENAAKFERIVCIVTDAEPIIETPHRGLDHEQS